MKIFYVLFLRYKYSKNIKHQTLIYSKKNQSKGTAALQVTGLAVMRNAIKYPFGSEMFKNFNSNMKIELGIIKQSLSIHKKILVTQQRS